MDLPSKLYLYICFFLNFFSVDSQKDLVQPGETHLQGVPSFIKHPKPLYYTMKGHPATIDCIAEPVSHAVIECAEQVIPYKGPDDSGRLKVTRLNSENKPDPEGKRWHLELQVRAKEVEEWFDSYVCRCEAWNKVVELQRPKKVVSTEAVIVEAYLDRKFQLEPVSTDLLLGKRLVLSCIPPRGKPEPEVYWLKDGKRVNKINFPHVILNDYNHLIIENVTKGDGGNYTCVAECIGIEYRYATAKVSVLDDKPFSEEEGWDHWGPCVYAGNKQIRSNVLCQQTRYRLCAKIRSNAYLTNSWPKTQELQQSPQTNCPQPWLQIRNCSASECAVSEQVSSLDSKDSLERNGEPKTSESALNIRELMVYVVLFMLLVCFLVLLTLFILRRRRSRFSISELLATPCCIKGKPSYQNEKNTKLHKDPLLLTDFKQSTMTIKNPITIDSHQIACDSKTMIMQTPNMESNRSLPYTPDHQYSTPMLGTRSLLGHQSIPHVVHLVENPSSPIIIGGASPFGLLPPVPPRLSDHPMNRVQECEPEAFLVSTPYCVTNMDNLEAFQRFPSTQQMDRDNELSYSAAAYTQINEYPMKYSIQEHSDVKSGLFTEHSVAPITPHGGSTLTEASSGNSSSNAVTHTTAVGSGNADSSSGSCGAPHSPSAFLQYHLIEPCRPDTEVPSNGLMITNQHAQTASRIPENTCEYADIDVVVEGTVTETGEYLSCRNSDVSLRLPYEALIGQPNKTFYLAVCREDRKRPVLDDKQTLLSPIIQFGLSQLKLNQPAVLSFPHCASLTKGSWFVRIISRPTMVPPQDMSSHDPSRAFESSQSVMEPRREDLFCSQHSEMWEETCVAAFESGICKYMNSKSGMLFRLDNTEVHLLTSIPQRYCLVGETLQPSSNLLAFTGYENQNSEFSFSPATKMLRLAAFSGKMTPSMDYNIRVYILADTNDALDWVMSVENRLDGFLLDTSATVPFRDTGRSMSFVIENISIGWRSRLQTQSQEVPFGHIWGGTQQSTLHCAFTLEHVDHAQNNVSCSIIAFQGGEWESRGVLNISSSWTERSLCKTATNFKSPIKTYRINSQSRISIIEMLKSKSCCYELAREMGMEDELSSLSNLSNPVDALLSLWEATHRHEASLGGMHQLFLQIGLAECANNLKIEVI